MELSRTFLCLRGLKKFNLYEKKMKREKALKPAPYGHFSAGIKIIMLHLPPCLTAKYARYPTGSAVSATFAV